MAKCGRWEIIVVVVCLLSLVSSSRVAKNFIRLTVELQVSDAYYYAKTFREPVYVYFSSRATSRAFLQLSYRLRPSTIMTNTRALICVSTPISLMVHNASGNIRTNRYPKTQSDSMPECIPPIIITNLDQPRCPFMTLIRLLWSFLRLIYTAILKLTVTEKECLAVIWSVEKLRHYLEGVHFTVITDHHSLLWLHRLKDPQRRLARWALRLQPYDFTLIHRPGKDHVVPDFLSRSVPVAVDAIETVNEDSFSFTTDKWYKAMFSRLEEHPHKFPTWRVENNMLYKYVKSSPSELATPSSSWKRVVPKDKRREVLLRCHDIPAAGHIGIFKTYWKVCQLYYWPKMRSDITRYVKACKVCAQNKVEQRAPAGLMGDRPNITQPWQCISLDFIGPLPRSRSGNQYVLVVNDYFTKFAVLFPSRSATARSLTKQVEEGIFLMFGAPQFLMCDQGSQMKSKEFKALCQRYKSKLFYTASYHPQADPTERANRVAKTMIRSFIRDSNHRTWDANLAAIGCAMRTSRHETTGYSPYYLNFGREHRLYGQDYADDIPKLDLDPQDFVKKRQDAFSKLYLDVQEKIKASRRVAQRRYNLRRRPVEYTPGQQVWRKNKSLSDATKYYSAKLAPPYIGPFIIKRKTGTCTYELQDQTGQNKGVWHVQDLKLFNPSIASESSDNE